MFGIIIKVILRSLLILHALLIRMTSLLGKRTYSSADKDRTVLLTGTFFSENWIMNHLKPISLSQSCSHVWIVSTFPIPDTAKVTWVKPPDFLLKLAGGVGARLITFVWMGLRKKPDFVGGFHLLLNGLLAAVLANIIRGRSLYFCGGGPREVLDGGIHGSRLFSLMGKPDSVLENKLIASVEAFDLVITMGSRAIPFFRVRGVTSRFEVVPGGIDSSKYENHDRTKKFDMILVGRFDPVKRIDTFIKTIGLLKEKIPRVSGVLVGRGETESEMKALVKEMGLEDNITFAGYQQDVIPWLCQSKIFVLTSDSEGLSLALMEAMMCAIPVVVSDVGELGELVDHGSNGYLLKERTAVGFSELIGELLQDEAKLTTFSQSAKTAAMKLEIKETAKKWDKILLDL